MFKLSSWLNFFLGPRLYMDSGGGGGGSAAPQQTTTYSTNIPEYAQPYVEQMLGSAQEEIFNYKNKPIYKTIGGKQVKVGTERVPVGLKGYKPFSKDARKYFAKTSPLQDKSYKAVSSMQAGPQGFQNDVGAYMSPYIQMALEPQLQAAARQSAIQGQMQQAQATQAGAFGGGREAIVRAERERALGDTQANIMSQGLQAAFDRAQNQYNQGFGQQQSLIDMQNRLGEQQQQRQQAILNQQIQNYATAQQYPMMQLGNMSNLLRGLPMQSTTVQGYQAQPNALSQLGGVGLTGAAIAGMGKGNAKGGRIKENKRPAGLAELALLKMA